MLNGFLRESFLVPLSTVIFLSLCGLCNGSCGTWETRIKVDHATCKSGVRKLVNIVTIIVTSFCLLTFRQLDVRMADSVHCLFKIPIDDSRIDYWT